MKQFLYILPLLLFSFAVKAAVIDFQSIEMNNALVNYHGFTYEEDGFKLNNLATSHAFGTFGTLASRYQGSTALFNDTVGGTTELVKSGGGTFDLYSIDLTHLNYSGGAVVTFVGLISGGGTVTQKFTVDNLIGFETFLFKGFKNLLKVSWDQDSPFTQFDNITLDKVSAVPVPAAAFLFMPAVLGFMGLRRKAKQA